MIRIMISFGLAALIVTHLLGAEEKADPATKRLSTLLSAMDRVLGDSPGYQVSSRSDWEYQHDDRKKSGENIARLSVAGNGRFRLDIGEAKAKKTRLICAGDNKQLTRLYLSEGQAFYTRDTGNLNILLQDRLTAMSLRGSGLDWIARKEPGKKLLEQISNVQYLGVKPFGEHKAHHFKVTWNGTPDVEFRIGAGKEPLLLSVSSQSKLQLRDKQTSSLSIQSRLTWTLGKISEKDLEITIPRDAHEVDDLLGHLRDGTVRQRIGKKAPDVSLATPDSRVVRLNDHKDRQVVVLFFWASWAAPSSDQMPRVLDFVSRYGKKGVVIHAINVGERAGVVNAFVRKQKYTGSVLLDPERKASFAFGVTSLPVTILIGKDGVVKSAHVGFTEDDRKGIIEDLEKVLSEK